MNTTINANNSNATPINGITTILSKNYTNTNTLINDDSFFIRDKNGKTQKVSDLFLNKEDFDIFILFLIHKGIINMDEFNEFKLSVDIFNKLNEK